MENYQENDLNYLSFTHDKKKVYSAYIIRQGVEEFIEYTKTLTPNKVVTGSFGADMKINLINDGPVTIYLEVKDGKVL